MSHLTCAAAFFPTQNRFIAHKNRTFAAKERNDMDWLKRFYTKYLAWINKYVLVTIGVFLLMCLDSDSNLYKRYMYDERIRNLEKEIKFYRDEIEINRQKLNELRTDKEGLERFAREEYFMKRENEDVYIIKGE